ncbi:MAG: hypothetical protein Q4C88_03005 [Akkermansia sp.]|nr:hypothetical protein [Akkermansia sp.]
MKARLPKMLLAALLAAIPTVYAYPEYVVVNSHQYYHGTVVITDAAGFGSGITTASSSTANIGYSESDGTIHNADFTLAGQGGTVEYATPNSLFIGGPGWPHKVSEGYPSAEGSLTLVGGAVLTVGTGSSHHVSMGNSAGAVSHLNVQDGSSLNTGILNVSSGGGAAYVNVGSQDSAGTINLSNYMMVGVNGPAETGAIGRVSIYNGSKLDARGAYIGYDSPNTTAGTGVVEVAQGGTFDTTYLCLGYGKGAEAVPSGTLSVAGSLHVTGNNDTCIGYEGGRGSLEVLVGGSADLGAADVCLGFYGTRGDDTRGSVKVQGGGSLTYGGTLWVDAHGEVSVDAGGTVFGNSTALLDGGTFINHGTIALNPAAAPDGVYLGRGSRFQTGTAQISGREDPNVPGELGIAYANGLEGVDVYYYDFGSPDKAVTIGALLEGKDEMQYLKRADMAAVNAAVQQGLALETTDGYELKFLHEIGGNLTVEYTTDELNHVNGTERLSVAGGGVVVESGAQEDRETKVGTIGSYRAMASETQASLAVSETDGGSKIWWHGTGLRTMADETTFFNKDFYLDINDEDGAGMLTVVTDSELDNESEIQALITVQDGAVLSNKGVLCFNTVVEDGGTLKGAGTIATTTVNGNLIVGNSPGLVTATDDLTLAPASNTTFSLAGLENPATAVMGGWDSGTYSRISLQVGASLVLQEGVRQFTIEFGGEDLLGSCLPGGQDTPITLNLLLAEGSVTLPQGYVGEMTEYGLDVTGLIDTVFCVTTDVAAGQGVADNMYVNFNEGDYHYYVNQEEGGTYNLTLRGSGTITRVPEPATGTLGLLALAALCMRRRRM